MLILEDPATYIPRTSISQTLTGPRFPRTYFISETPIPSDPPDAPRPQCAESCNCSAKNGHRLWVTHRVWGNLVGLQLARSTLVTDAVKACRQALGRIARCTRLLYLPPLHGF